MITESRTTAIEFNEELIRKVVYAITKALLEDLPQERHENFKETNNRFRAASGDYINDNLRNLVVDENIKLIPFIRGGWEGRILVDNQNKVTYTVMRGKTLQRAINLQRKSPYYLKSILVQENGDCEGHNKQLSVFDKEYGFFTEDEYEEDYDRIVQGQIEKTSGYRHYIFVYETYCNEIKDIKLLFLDKDFAEIDSLNLLSYLTPDFALLTTTVENDDMRGFDEVPKDKQREGLLRVREGVKPVLKVIEKEI